MMLFGMPFSRASLATALAFVFSVVGIFAALRDQGPESTVARYFQAISTGNRELEGSVIRQSVDNPASQLLRSYVLNRATPPAVIGVHRTTQIGSEAAVTIVMERPDYGTEVVLFSMVKPVIRWKIDTDKTLSYSTRR